MGQTPAENKAAIDNLTSTLIGIGKKDASLTYMSHKLADDIWALADPDHETARVRVEKFADELTTALYGKKLPDRSVTVLQQSIREVIRGSSPTFPSAANVRQILTAAGVEELKVQVVTRSFMAIGEEIRGPDDLGRQK